MTIRCAALLSVLALAVIPAASPAAPAQPVWVEITRKVPMCWVIYRGEENFPEEEALAVKTIRAAAPRWKPGAPLPADCGVLEPGARFIMALKQPRGALKLYEHCHSCAPYMVPYYLPGPRAGAAYFKPSSAPKDGGRHNYDMRTYK